MNSKLSSQCTDNTDVVSAPEFSRRRGGVHVSEFWTARKK